MPDGGNLITSKAQFDMAMGQALDVMIRHINPNDPLKDVYMSFAGMNPDLVEKVQRDTAPAIAKANAISKMFRQNTRRARFPTNEDLLAKGAISKAQLDVNTLTNFASITGGQSLGYVSLDTQMARGTVRPNSFTLYQALHKSAAFQVVDYWPYASDTGGGLPGTAFQGFGNVASGTLSTSAGVYQLNNITLKLAVNGRAITTALAAQNSFVDVTAQENINAALTVLESVNYCCYWGNPTLFANQFQGIAGVIPSGNIFDYQSFYNTYASAQGWSSAQALFNLIYEAAASITSYRQYGRITHAFMSPVCAGSLQSLVTTLLNNIVTRLTPTMESVHGVIVDGDLQGIRTRFGEIQFPIDFYITARDKPAQTIVYGNGANAASTSAPTPPASVTATAVTGTVASGSAWTAAYAASSGVYSYAVASCDSSMNESYLTYLASGAGSGSTLSISGVAAVSGAYSLSITGPTAADAAAFRIYRSGLGYAPASSGVANAAAYRYIGTVAASGASAVTFVDNNTYIPGSETIFLLDLDENDQAVDFRFLLPLTRIELFAANLYMPWAVAEIGSVRVKISKFNGLVKNYVPDNTNFYPLQANANAT
jgi:hypothetical protein